MIKFFRKIRYDPMADHKTKKYLKYAVSKIVRVMIGVLIALQVSNWNQNQIKNIQGLDDLENQKWHFKTLI
jgi:hypothetical protein